MPLSDNIERFIKDLMSESQSELELRRNELAQYFGCAPSQINYVLSTRFSPEHGYIIESRRGGAGYVRIIRIEAEDGGTRFIRALAQSIDQGLSLSQANAMISALAERQLIAPKTAAVMRGAVSDAAINLPVNAKDLLRAGVMRAMLSSLLTAKE